MRVVFILFLLFACAPKSISYTRNIEERREAIEKQSRRMQKKMMKARRQGIRVVKPSKIHKKIQKIKKIIK